MTAPAAQNSKRIAWHGDVCLGIAQIMVWGGSLFLLAVLAEPIHADTGWSMTWIYGALSVGVLVSALLSPAAGRRIARGQGRAILIAAGLAIALGIAIVGIAEYFAVFLLGWCLIGVGMAGGLYDPLFATLGRHYGRESRKSINTVTLVAGFASTVAWPIQAWMVAAWGWRDACLVYAAVLMVAVVPLYCYAMPRHHLVLDEPKAVESKAMSPQGVDELPAGLYGLLSLVFSIAAILMTAMSVQIILLLKGSGHSDAAAIALAALIGPSMVFVRFLSMPFRHLPPVWLALFSAACVALGLALISLAPMAAAFGIVCYGIGNGLRAVVRGTLPLSLLSPASLPLVMGRLSRSSLLCQAFTPVACGFLFTHLGAQGTLWALTALAVANALLTALLLQRIKSGVRLA
ncbi:MFS transporter [Acidovorax sp. CCYZU-2555]|uniref:MFS transporter n=1 Tax=Acidovorax sp. CCYZU-2555 TaxID=2835042 RepID=UPI001BCF471B|nr:MFS transporter [Acidovorax sp. CCYZU-2555]MBS7781201.1 MFS transporter [Acidovorax sp. CCYZU-2555]